MAEDDDINTIIPGLDQMQESMGSARNMADSLLNSFNTMVDSMSKADESGASSFNKLMTSAQSAKEGLDRIWSSLELLKEGKFLDNVMQGFKDAGSIATSFTSKFLGSMGDVVSATDDVGRMANAVAPFIGALGNQAAIKALPDIIHKTEAAIKEVEKKVLQASAAFGDLDVEAGFQNATDNVQKFNAAIAESIITTRRSGKEVMAVTDILSKAFGPMNATMPLKNIIATHGAVKSSITATNAALQISNALGIDSQEVAGAMASAYYELGAEIEDSVSMMGSIYDASRKSGLGFQTTAKTILGMTKELKFFGTSVESVGPLFARFAESMAGVGKRGLTVELLQSFVSGLSGMQMGTKALLGTRLPGGAGGGALAGGLRMEQALEKGDFETISKTITDTLKQFGGERILTREEALTEPGGERQYLMQRQLMGQMLGISDAGKQDQMLKLLSDIDKKGIDPQTAEETKKTMEDLLKSGEQVADNTTTRLEKANQMVEAAVYSSVSEVSSILKTIAAQTGVDVPIKTLTEIMEQSVTRGHVDLAAIQRQLDERAKAEEAAKKAEKETTPSKEDKELKSIAEEAASSIEMPPIPSEKSVDLESILKATKAFKDAFGRDIMGKEEALTKPGGEQQYIEQRQFLGQQLGISDTTRLDDMLYDPTYNKKTTKASTEPIKDTTIDFSKMPNQNTTIDFSKMPKHELPNFGEFASEDINRNVQLSKSNDTKRSEETMENFKLNIQIIPELIFKNGQIVVDNISSHIEKGLLEGRKLKLHMFTEGEQ